MISAGPIVMRRAYASAGGAGAPGRVLLAGLLRMLPELLTRATTYAHAAANLAGWALLADLYSVTYHLAARHRWMDEVSAGGG